MIRKLALGLIAAGLMAASPVFAASDVSNDGGAAVVAVTAIAAPIASAQTASLISGAIGGAISGGIGGLGGGFSPSGGGLTPSISGVSSRDAGRAGGAGDKRFGAWTQAGYTTFENSQTGLQLDGSAYNLLGGLDYMVNDRVVVGLTLGYEVLDITTTFNAGTTEANGFGITPYVGMTLNKTWSVDAAAGYTWLNYDVTRTSNTVRGSYDAERWFGSANLNGNYAFGRFRVLPKVGVLYLEEKSDAYTESTGGRVGEQKTKLGRLSGGARFGYAFDKVMPYVKVIGEYDFEKNAAVALGNGSFSHDDEFGAQLGAGFDFYGSNTISGNLEGAYMSAGREDLDVWTVSARLRMKF